MTDTGQAKRSGRTPRTSNNSITDSNGNYTVPLKRLSADIDAKHIGVPSSDSNDSKSNAENTDERANTNASTSTTPIPSALKSDFQAIQKQWIRVKTKDVDAKAMKRESSITTVKCAVFRTCNCVKRLLFILSEYDTFCRKNARKSVVKGLSMNTIVESLTDYSLIQFWDDFIHTKEQHFQSARADDRSHSAYAHTNTNASADTGATNTNAATAAAAAAEAPADAQPHEHEDIQRVFDFFAAKLGTCTMHTCHKHTRNLRDKAMAGDVETRKQLYFGYSQSIEIVCLQFFDTIHDYIFHSNEMINAAPDTDTNTNNNNNKTPSQSDSQSQSQTNSGSKRKSVKKRKSKTKLKMSREIENESEAQPNKNNKNTNTKKRSSTKKKKGGRHAFHSKFVTEVFDQTSMINIKPSFGVSFVYWNGYRGWNNYIPEPTHANLKVELLNNALYAITGAQWRDIVVKSGIFKQTLLGVKWKAKNAGILNKRYSVPAGLPISQPHIMAVLFYINFNALAFLFKRRGCRKLHRKEVSKDVRARNVLIGNWYKLFTECITLFGEITKPRQIFYHGLTDKILFDEFKPNFNCMISCTANLKIVQQLIQKHYIDHGMVIELQQQRSVPYGFLNVSFMSDYQHENEKIFSFSRLDVVDIYYQMASTNKFESHSVFVKALVLFQCILKGHYFEFELNPNQSDQNILIQMIRNWMERNNTSGSQSEEEDNNNNNNAADADADTKVAIPAYMQDLFDSFIVRQRKLFVIRSQYFLLCQKLKTFLLLFNDNLATLSNNGNASVNALSPLQAEPDYELGSFLDGWKWSDSVNGRLVVYLMREYEWQIAGEVMERFRALPVNGVIRSQYFDAGNNVILYQRLRRSDKDFPDKAMMFLNVEQMPNEYNRIYLQWELFCKETNYRSTQCLFLKRNGIAGYTVSSTLELCALTKFRFETSVQILNVEKTEKKSSE